MAISAFVAQGNTVAISASNSASTPVQVSGGNNGSQVYAIYNDTGVAAFVVLSPISTNAVIPTAGTPANGVPVPTKGLVYWTGPANAYVSVILGSTTGTVYVTPGDGK